MNEKLGTYQGKPIDESMTKQELLEVIKHVAGQYTEERKYNQKLEKVLPVDWQQKVADFPLPIVKVETYD